MAPVSRHVVPSVLKLQEMWYAWRTSRRLLGLYYRVRAAMPSVPGRPLYEEVVARWAGIDRNAAAAALRRAERSLSGWTADRDLSFRDVAMYVIASSYMQSHPGRYGMRADVAGIVRRVIPASL